VVQVKENQKSLFNALEITSQISRPLDYFESTENSRGRKEIRKTQLFSPLKNLPQGWPELNSIIRVERFTFRNKKNHYEQSYYISSLKPVSAELFAKGIRGHWSIENRLHYVKDVLQNEDNSGIKKGNGIEVLSLCRNIAINISRGLGFDSIKYAQTYFASNVKELLKKLRI